MSGNTKRRLYNFTEFTLRIAAFAGVILLIVFTVPRPVTTPVWLIWLAFIATLALRIPAAVHELGHLLFGWIAGMKLVSITFSYLKISAAECGRSGEDQKDRSRRRVRLVDPAYAGATEMHPWSGGHVRAKTIVFTLGGPTLCLAVGIALLLVYVLLPFHIGTLFGGLMSIFLVQEGLIALLPAELPAGKTDGAVLVGLLKHAAEEEIMLRVLTAQGILNRGTYADIDRDMLFLTPIVREDLPAFHALLLLRRNYLAEMGDEEGAKEISDRLLSLEEYMTEEERAEIEKFRT